MEYPTPHLETLLETVAREGEDYGRRQGHNTKMLDSFEPHFPLQLEPGTTSLQHMNDSDVPPPLPLAKAQIHHDRLHKILMQQRAMVQGTD